MSRKVFLSEIVDAASRVFCLAADDIVSESRLDILMPARYAVYRLGLERSGLTLASLSRHLGRDHSTVKAGARKCCKWMQADPVYRAQVRQVRRLLKNCGRIRKIEQDMEHRRIERIRLDAERREAERVEQLLSDESELDDLDLISARVSAYRAKGGSFVEVFS